MADKTDDVLAQQLYDHYCTARGGRDDDGVRLPCWAALAPAEKDVWRRFTQLAHWAAVRHHEAHLLKVTASQPVVTCTRTGCAPDGTQHGGSCPIPSMPPPRRHVPPRQGGLGEVRVTVRVPESKRAAAVMRRD